MNLTKKKKMTGFLFLEISSQFCDWLSLTTNQVRKKLRNKKSYASKYIANAKELFLGSSKLSHLPHQMSESALNLARVQCPLVTLCAKFPTLSRADMCVYMRV